MNKKTILFWLSILAAVSIVSGETLSFSMVLKDKAVVSDTIIRIKDLAVMDPSIQDRIGGLVIAVSPEMGNTTTILKQEIVEKLIGNGIASPQLTGPNSITVLRKGTIIDPAFFKDKILEFVINHSPWKDGVQVEIVSNKSVIVPESGIRWQLTPANGQDFFGNVLFKADAISSSTNEYIYSTWIVAKLKIVKPVAISNRMIQKNETLNATDIRWENRELDAFTRDAILETNEIIGQKTGRIIRPNSVITAGLMEKKFLVRRGDTAALVAQFKGIKATSSVKVLSDGCFGDTIQVMSNQSRKIITAVVTGKNTVEVTVE